jgi:gamma-glutamylcysteine synthetase
MTVPVVYSADEKKRLQAAIDEIAAIYSARFPESIQTPRIVGREAEYPLVDAQGRVADVRRLWDALADSGQFRAKFDTGRENLLVALEGTDYSYALEVGVGTLEINSRPCSDLFTLDTWSQQAVGALVHAAARHGSQVLGYGIQPVTVPHVSIMSPKQRYESLFRAMGDAWLWYAITASDQIQIDIRRDELLQMLNYGNLIAPVIIAFCGNSPVYGGQLSPFCSGREGRMAEIHANEHRHGMPPRPYTGIDDYVASVSQSTHLILQAGNEVVPGSRPFSQHLLENGADFEAFLFHEHYVWNSARVRVAYGTVEIRPACQQPWSEHMAAMALILGLVEAHEAVDAYIQDALGAEYWETMRAYHTQFTARGLDAPQPAPNFLETLLDLTARGLHSRGQGEEAFLAPLRERLERRENPGQRARRVFQIDGLPGLLRLAAIRPDMVTHQ